MEKSLNMRQGYLSHDALSSVRIRVYGDHADINVKSTRDGIHRLEYEYPIPLPDAQELLSRVAHRPLIEKTRHVLHQACLRPRDRFWDIPVPKIDSAFDKPIGAPAVLVTKHYATTSQARCCSVLGSQ